MPKLRIVFLGGIFWGDNQDAIQLNSIGRIQNAADSLQKKYIDGFSAQSNINSVTVINLPFIFPYPKHYKKIFYRPSCKTGSYLGSSVQEKCFFNLVFFRLFSRMYAAFFGSFFALRKDLQASNEQIIFMCYSMHLPFILSSVMLKVIFKKPLFGLIVPDLPEFMAERKGLRKIFYNFTAKVSYKLARKFDFVVPITQQACTFFVNQPAFVIEGMSDATLDGQELLEQCFNIDLPEKFFLYTGTLDRRYGILELISAFENSKAGDHKLVICGAGDAYAEVLQASKLNKHVLFLGQLARENVIALQAKASFLINSRRNTSVYTRYSFPSKVLEYMSSGTPVVMYKLDGIPNEYYQFCYLIDDFNSDLNRAISELSMMNRAEVLEKGRLAKEFVLQQKNPRIQVFSLLGFIKEKFNV